VTALRQSSGRLPALPFVAVLIVAAVALVAACGGPSPTAPSPTASSASTAASALVATGATSTGSTLPERTGTSSSGPSLTPVPGAPGPTPAMTLPAMTETAFGRVWDGVPPSWPTLPGQSESEVGSDASASLVVHGKPEDLARFLRNELVARGWRVDVGSVLENGSVVVDAIGAAPGCKAQAQFTPNSPGSDDGGVLIYYGAACPFT
jgi:hypothetical protein